MANYDPVLDRSMFQSRDTKGRGITSADISDDTTSVDLKSRREQAAALIEQAKKKFDPSNFQTLNEQERPEVFRPVAVNMPAPQQTTNTAQRMQQMAAQGVPQPVQQQPVQMAIGGLAAFAQGGLNRSNIEGGGDADFSDGYSTQDMLEPSEKLSAQQKLSPTVGDFNALGERFKNIKSDVQGIGSLNAPRSKKDSMYLEDFSLPSSSSASSRPSKGSLSIEDPSLWTDDDIEAIADSVVANAKQGATPLARGIQSLSKTSNIPDRDAVVSRLKSEREQEIQVKTGGASEGLNTSLNRDSKRDAAMEQARKDFAARQEAVAAAKEANPVKGILEPQTPEERSAAIAAQEAAASSAISKLNTTPMAQPAGVDTYATTASSAGLPSLPNRPDEGGGSLPTPATTPIATPAAAPPMAQPAGLNTYATTAPTPSAPSQTLNAYSPQTEAGGPASDATMSALNAYKATKSGGAGAGAGTAMPSTSDTTGGLTLEDIKARRNQERQDNFNMALMQAGLAIAGGKSSNALSNIGEGGLAGVQAFTKGEQESRVLERERMADMRALQQMKNEQLYRQATLSNEAARLGISQEELKNRIGETAFKQGPEFEYLKNKAAEDRQARIDMRTQTNLTAAVNRFQNTTIQLGAQLNQKEKELEDARRNPIYSGKDDPDLIARIQDLQNQLDYENNLLKTAQKQAGLNVGDVPLPTKNPTAGFKYLGPATKAP